MLIELNIISVVFICFYILYIATRNMLICLNRRTFAKIYLNLLSMTWVPL